MGEIDRRALIGAAGATIALGACSTSNGKAEDKPWMQSTGVEWTGVFPNFGNPLTATKPDPLADGVTFDPKFVCVIYMKIEPNGQFTVRHGYEAYPGNVAAERLLVETLLRAAASGNWNHAKGERVKRREHNFDNFSLNSQQRVWLYIDNRSSEMAFEDRNGNGYIVRFAPMSGVDPENKLPANANRKIYPNNAFFNINVMDTAPIAGLQGHKLISLDYWNTDTDGKKISVTDPNDVAKHHLYSINIHLKLAMSKKPGPNSPAQWLPMIVDPDGGNMGSQP